MVNSTLDEFALQGRDVTVRRRGNEVLRSVNFRCPRGSITGLLGPSGCGKTTLMRSIMGVQRVASGHLTVLGLPAGSRQLRPRVAYTSQSISIYTDISVRANVTHFGYLVGADNDAVELAIDRVQLGDFANRRVDSLSGGQANRASLACALVGDPEVLVLDEPTVGLDPLTRQSLWLTFREICEDGTTILVSSHVMDEAARCDSALYMRRGRFLAHEPVASLQERTGTTNPEDAFIALIRQEDKQ